MRTATALLLGFFLASTLLGCGSAAIPEPPDGAKAGPPPGTSPELTKKIEKKFEKKKK